MLPEPSQSTRKKDGFIKMYTTDDIKRIRKDLLQSIEEVIKLLLSVSPKSISGAFIVPREVCCYIDFLGALYCGWDGKNRNRIATSDKAVSFIERIFSQVDINYKTYAKLFYNILRHGTVHCLRPHKLERRNGRTIEWFIYGGQRKNCQGLYEGRTLIASHLQPMVWDDKNKRDIFPVSSDCLYEDLKKAINIYFDKLEEEINLNKSNLLTNFESTMSALMQPEKVDLIW